MLNGGASRSEVASTSPVMICAISMTVLLEARTVSVPFKGKCTLRSLMTLVAFDILAKLLCSDSSGSSVNVSCLHLVCHR